MTRGLQSWIRRLLGSGEARMPGRDRVRLREPLSQDARTIVSVPEIDFVGRRATSANGRFALLWRDRHWAEGQAVTGRYLLIDGDAVLLDERMARPQDGKVADDGTFVLNDAGDDPGLSGTFRAFRSDGGVIVSRDYSANLLNNGLSDDGRLAVCQTANAPGSPDSSVLSVFDLVARTETANWTAESGWAASYEFPEGGTRIRMVRPDRPSLDYSIDGEFIDRRLWLRDEVVRGSLYVIRKALAEGEAVTGLTHEDLRRGAKRAIADGDRRLVGEAWRLLGEIEEAAADPPAALAAYERALAADPKVGVARRAGALRRALAR